MRASGWYWSTVVARPGVWISPIKPRPTRAFLATSVPVSDGPWEGLMCLAFHPKFSTNRRYFLKHETLRQEQRWTVLREHRASEDGLRDSGQAPRELCAMAQPADNHNGGTLAFGPDGMLYFAMGDGGRRKTLRVTPRI